MGIEGALNQLRWAAMIIKDSQNRIHRVGKELARMRRAWPEGGADAVMEARRLIEQVRPTMHKIGFDLDRGQL